MPNLHSADAGVIVNLPRLASTTILKRQEHVRVDSAHLAKNVSRKRIE